MSTARDPMSTRDQMLARIDGQRDKAVKNLSDFETAEARADAAGDPGAILSAVRSGMEALRAHLSDLGEQRRRWVS